jgi:hypothetical protein
MPAQTANRLRLFANPGDGRRQINFFQISFDRGTVHRLPANAAGFAHPRGCRCGICRRQRLIGKPGVGDESAGSRGAHHITAPKRINP